MYAWDFYLIIYSFLHKHNIIHIAWSGLTVCALTLTKSESILFGTRQRLRTFPVIPSINIAGNDIKLSDQITSLGVIMDSTLTFDAHVTALCKACHFHLRSLRHIRRSLSTDMAISIAVAMVQSRLDYCNSLLYGISAFNINKLQRVQNLAAKIALNDWHSPSQELLGQLHWLPVHSRINFKISSLTLNFWPRINLQTFDHLLHHMFLSVCWGHPTNPSLFNHPQEHPLVNASSECLHHTFGTLYHCPFDFLDRSHRLKRNLKNILFCSFLDTIAIFSGPQIQL